MALPLARLGTVGAVALLIGLVLVGSGFVVTAEAEQTEINCNYATSNNNCQQTEENAQNTSIVAQFIIAAGAIASGIGLFFVVYAMISIMARREETSSLAPQPPSWVGPVRVPRMEGPPPPSPPPPSTPPGQW